jgi:hypothetical protein
VEKRFFVADFHVLGLFTFNKHDLSKRKIRLSRAAVRRNLYRAYSLPLKSYKAEILAPGIIWANLMHHTLRILIIFFFRVAVIQIFGFHCIFMLASYCTPKLHVICTIQLS